LRPKADQLEGKQGYKNVFHTTRTRPRSASTVKSSPVAITSKSSLLFSRQLHRPPPHHPLYETCTFA
jgi:hypothetical protein